jgi:ribose 5-phosphate isomerase B
MKPIAIGGDPNAADLKKVLIKHLESLGYTCLDYGSEDPIYANVAFQVAEAVAKGKHDRGILLCGTGIGVSIAANKVRGAYAARVSDAFSAERAKKSNNANIVTLGSQVTGPELAKKFVEIWLASEFDPESRSGPKVQRICRYEDQAKPE